MPQVPLLSVLLIRFRGFGDLGVLGFMSQATVGLSDLFGVDSPDLQTTSVLYHHYLKSSRPRT